MNRPTTLLTENDVVLFAPMNYNFPRCDIKTIFLIEQAEARSCLGESHYTELLADLVDYSAAVEYQEGTAYAVDQTVSYKGVYYTSINATNNPPSYLTDWQYADKFQSATNNDLWPFLGQYLALVVLKSVIPMTTVDISAQGMVQSKGETFDPASDATVKRVQYALDALIATAYANLENELGRNLEGDTSSDNCGTQSLVCSCGCGCTTEGAEVTFIPSGAILFENTNSSSCSCSCGRCKGYKRNNLNTYDVA